MQDVKASRCGWSGAMQNINRFSSRPSRRCSWPRSSGAATRTKSASLATMSHESRTPLNGVLGMPMPWRAMCLTYRHASGWRFAPVRRGAGPGIINEVSTCRDRAGKLSWTTPLRPLRAGVGRRPCDLRATAQCKVLDFDVQRPPAARAALRSATRAVRHILYTGLPRAEFTGRPGEGGGRPPPPHADPDVTHPASAMRHEDLPPCSGSSSSPTPRTPLALRRTDWACNLPRPGRDYGRHDPRQAAAVGRARPSTSILALPAPDWRRRRKLPRRRAARTPRSPSPAVRCGCWRRGHRH